MSPPTSGYGQVGLNVLILFFLLFFVGVKAESTQFQEPIPLVVKPLSFTPDEFYIAGVVDEREDPSAVGWLIPTGVKGGKTQAVDLQGGGKKAIEAFLTNSFEQDKSLRPVIARLQECRIIERPGEKGVIEGELVLHIAFDLEKEKAPDHLVDYRGGIRYKRSINQQGTAASGLQRALTGALEFLHKWMQQEVGTNPKLAERVEVIFEDQVENTDNDTVFYNPSRPLVWDDFRAKPQGRQYSASIFPSFAWEGESTVVDGVIYLHLQFKVYMLKSSSWVRTPSAYGLNHEQRHFDLVKIVVERFKEKLLDMQLTPDDYEGVLGYQYLETYREMNQLQDQYEKETQNGMNKTAQQKWNQWIEEELQSYSVGE